MLRPPLLVLSDGHAARHKDVRNGMEKSALVLGDDVVSSTRLGNNTTEDDVLLALMYDAEAAREGTNTEPTWKAEHETNNENTSDAQGNDATHQRLQGLRARNK